MPLGALPVSHQAGKDIPLVEKQRNEQLLRVHRATVKNVFQPLKLYPIFFAFIVCCDIADLAIVGSLPPFLFSTEGSAY